MTAKALAASGTGHGTPPSRRGYGRVRVHRYAAKLIRHSAADGGPAIGALATILPAGASVIVTVAGARTVAVLARGLLLKPE
ncbi:MAG TPA: hypothetical protein VF342_06855 [Alphaproteobacteria bacterium]